MFYAGDMVRFLAHPGTNTAVALGGVAVAILAIGWFAWSEDRTALAIVLFVVGGLLALLSVGGVGVMLLKSEDTLKGGITVTANDGSVQSVGQEGGQTAQNIYNLPSTRADRQDLDEIISELMREFTEIERRIVRDEVSNPNLWDQWAIEWWSKVKEQTKGRLNNWGMLDTYSVMAFDIVYEPPVSSEKGIILRKFHANKKRLEGILALQR